MQSFLVVGGSQNDRHAYVLDFVKKLKIALIPYGIAKIDDVRKLGSFTNLKVGEKTAIYIKGIDLATEEAQNAFLKNLEEPQENLYYILTSSSTRKVLPTVVSRCQVITINSLQLTINNEGIEKFLEMSVGEKLSYVDKIKDRENAIIFIEEFIFACHTWIHKANNGYALIARYAESGMQTLKNLRANGNVTLQLANFVIRLV